MKAIYNHFHTEKPTGSNNFNGLVLRCISGAGTSTMFVRQVVIAPLFRVMLAYDRQLNDMVVRFLSSAGFSMDTTFNIGDYLATVVVFRPKILMRWPPGTNLL